MTRAKPAATARLLTALDRKERAEADATTAARAAFPNGTEVVIGMSDLGPNVSVRIETATGAKVWKDLRAVLRGEGLL